jgi:hypothetical protein
MSHAADSASPSTQNTPKLRGSGMPNMPANTYSGDNATPATTRARSLPLMTASSRSPCARPRACAKASETHAGSAPSASARPGDIDASSARPLRSVSRFSAWGRRRSRPMSWPAIGSDRPGICTRTRTSTVACACATPGRAWITGSSVRGARFIEANTSAKRPCT